MSTRVAYAVSWARRRGRRRIAALRVLADRHGRGQVRVGGRGTGLPAEAAAARPLELQVRSADDGGACVAIEVPAAATVRNDAAAVASSVAALSEGRFRLARRG